MPTGATNYRVEYQYDYMDRRIQRVALQKIGNQWYASNSRIYLYDGWNIVAEITENSNSGTKQLEQSYLWGLDISNSPQGAGGVGGLLAIERHTGNQAGLHFASCDGNGNVVALTNAADGNLSASYEYDPFGNLLESSGAFAQQNPYRFSTKRQDELTGFYYYGYRSYNPQTGRWLNRDPIAENGGLNLYGFIGNDPVNYIDKLGLLETPVTIQNYNTILNRATGRIPSYVQPNSTTRSKIGGQVKKGFRVFCRSGGGRSRNTGSPSTVALPFLAQTQFNHAQMYQQERLALGLARLSSSGSYTLAQSSVAMSYAVYATDPKIKNYSDELQLNAARILELYDSETRVLVEEESTWVLSDDVCKCISTKADDNPYKDRERVYKMEAMHNGWYNLWRMTGVAGSPRGPFRQYPVPILPQVQLQAGDTYRYGRTADFSRHFTETYPFGPSRHAGNRVRIFQIFAGNEYRTRLFEQAKLLEYYYQHGEFPPGNSVGW